MSKAEVKDIQEKKASGKFQREVRLYQNNEKKRSFGEVAMTWKNFPEITSDSHKLLPKQARHQKSLCFRCRA